jgi:hypothetical protein
MRRRIAAIALALVGSLAGGAPATIAAQDPGCPTVNVTCPDQVEKDTPLTVTAIVSGGDPNVTPTFNWTVSAGTISSGQGTSSITVDTTGVDGGQFVTATVDIGGYSRECSTSSSCTSSVAVVAEARKIDEYSRLRTKDENARLDNLAIELQNDPTTQAYLFVYGGRRSRRGDQKKAVDRAKTYLVKTRGIDSTRLVVADGGYREEAATELWIVPTGALPPDASPTLDPSEVMAPKGSKKSSKPSKPAKRRKRS